MLFTKFLRGIAAGALALAALGAHAHTVQNTPLEKIYLQSEACSPAHEARVLDVPEENAFVYGECASGDNSHAGVLLIDEKTGATKYYEYGRYSPNLKGIVGAKLPQDDGNVRKVLVPNVKVGKDGKPNPESLKKVYEFLSKEVGHGAEVEPDYQEGADEDRAEKEIMKVANDFNRAKYKLLSNNCKHFCNDIVNDSKQLTAPK